MDDENRWLVSRSTTLVLIALVGLANVVTDLGSGDRTVAPADAVAAEPVAPYADQPRQPNQWFFAERAYPFGHIPLERWRAAQQKAAEMRTPARAKSATWTAEGPTNISGRITDLVVDPGNEDVVFAGAAEGGVLRSTDGGQSWTPVFDDQPSLSIGALAIDPNNSSIIYAGTGEVNPGGGSVAYGGAGLLRSLDQGDTWSLVGLENSGAIGRIVIDPTDSNTIFVAVLGRLWETHVERGVYRSTNGGSTWQKVLYVADDTGCVDLILRPDSPAVLFAAMWQRLRQPEVYDYGGPNSAVYTSIDGGDSWAMVGGGLPSPSTDSGRIGLSLSASQPDVMHAVYADRTGYFDGLYRSIDGGASWSRTTDSALSNVFGSFGWWFGNVRTHPNDPDSIWILGLDVWSSADGGASYSRTSGGMHVDQHGFAFGPGLDPVMYAGNDGGVYRSDDGGATWPKLPDQPITQAYRIALDANNADAIYIGAQDNGTPRTQTGAVDDWVDIFVGDGFQPLVHPLDSDQIWAQAQYGSLYYSSNGGSSWLSATFGVGGTDRIAWNAPLIQDPHDPDTRYFGTHRVYRSVDPRNWTSISGDLTGGVHQGNNGQVNGTLTTLAVSPVDADVLWAGSDDGKVRRTTMGGGLWNDVSSGLPDRWITSVRADPFDRETAYVTVSGFRWNEALPHVYQTTDLGSNWQAISGNLPEAPVNDLLADPDISGRFIVATDVGVYVTSDGGTTWSELGAGLPRVVVTALALDPVNDILYAATYGRSVFSLPMNLGLLFTDGFESGDISAWSTAVP